MRKKTIILIADKLFWFIIMLMPVLFYIISPLAFSIGGGSATADIVLPTFSGVLADFGINTDNIIYSSLSALFGETGVIHFFNADSVVLLYMSYIAFIEILHLFIDFIVFIPRLARKFLDRFTLDVELSSRSGD